MINLKNWKFWLIILALLIVVSTIFYSNYLAQKIKSEEIEQIAIFGKALKAKADLLINSGEANQSSSLDLVSYIAESNTSIPIIETDENDIPTNHFNLDSLSVIKDSNYIKKQLLKFKKLYKPIIVQLSNEPLVIQKYYYGNSKLLDEVRYYPLIQLIIVALFSALLISLLQTQNKSTQNQLWAGMAKETAHQLGTPITSLQGWLEILKDIPQAHQYANEMENDVHRLKLVSERFGKIGSQPQLQLLNIVEVIDEMIIYMQKRASQYVQFIFEKPNEDVNIHGNKELLQWLFENLYKNALDAIEGKGQIITLMKIRATEIEIEVIDNGKGISKAMQRKIFKPGFTTKKRGWGLGLAFCKRIVEQYHRGKLYLKKSEPGVGTVFSIVLLR